ncbi:MAG: heterodisulfide reductase-related iron-sulfur binding cluster [Nitrospirae bacterium]|nr:heterodisulfide reductase-related iron-sulfur binding cluster [Nitrospirota bacterium]MDA1303874.1 heterodisulfide reductase-related iron-sulfur binding cluster [Nitrospirota bacterium]
MKGIDLISTDWTRSDLEQETNRIFDVCDGCRRCFNLCPSFNTLLDRIDEYDSDVSKITAADYEQVEQECYYCKLCFNHCPYTPPHQYEIDFPRLMAAWKKLRVQEKGASWRDRLLIQTDLIGKLGGMTASLTNWALSTPWIRGLVENVVGLHRDRQVLFFSKESFPQWWRKRSPKTPSSSAQHKVILFPSCMVNYQATDIGKATVQVLEKNGVKVVVPEGQRCCSMPSFDVGDTDTMVQTARHHLKLFQPYLDQGYDLVIPTPSCSLMFKREYPYLMPTPEMKHLAERTFDVCEYLMRLKKNGALSLEFTQTTQRIAYQVPCHLRDQNIGFKSKELMELTGAQVELIEKCSGHDGSWGAKVEFFDLSMKIAKKAVRQILNSEPYLVASDCPLSALQLDQAGATQPGKGPMTQHPIQIIRDAYRLPS